jgi:hypothetical protein
VTVGFEPTTSAQRIYRMTAIKGEWLKSHPLHSFSFCMLLSPPFLQAKF